MGLKSFCALVLAAATLSGCVETQRNTENGPPGDPPPTGVTQAQFNAASRACKYPPYAVRFGGANIEGSAELDLSQLLASETAAQTIVEGSLEVEGQAVFRRRIVGGYASAAVGGIGENYFCRLESVFAGNTQALAEISAARALYRDLARELLDRSIYYPNTAEIRQERRELIAAFNARAAALSRGEFTRARVQAGLGDFRYAEQNSVELSGAVKGFNFGDIQGCAGVSVQSLVVIDTRVLNTADEIDDLIAGMLVGDGNLLISRLASLGSEILGDGATASTNLSVDQITCVGDAAERVATRRTNNAAAGAQTEQAATPTEETQTEPETEEEAAPEEEPATPTPGN